MEHIRKEIKRALLVCVPYFVIVFFQDDLDKLLFSIHSRMGNPLMVVYLFLATVIIFALFIHTVSDLRENYKASGYMAIAPMMIYLIVLINSFWSPLRISSDVFHSKMVYSAFRKDTHGHAKMKLHENGSMDIRYPGPFGMSEWEYGKWSERDDTFYLDYDQAADVKPDTLILSADGLLAPVGIPADTLNIYRDHFFRMAVTRKK